MPNNDALEAAARADYDVTMRDNEERETWDDYETIPESWKEFHRTRARAVNAAWIGALTDEQSFAVTEATYGASLRNAKKSDVERIEARTVAFRAALLETLEVRDE